jgi:hypothetical protein
LLDELRQAPDSTRGLHGEEPAQPESLFTAYWKDFEKHKKRYSGVEFQYRTAIEVLTHLKSTLAPSFSKLTTAPEPNVPGVQRVQLLIVSAEASVESNAAGHLASIKPPVEHFAGGRPTIMKSASSSSSAIAVEIAQAIT